MQKELTHPLTHIPQLLLTNEQYTGLNRLKICIYATILKEFAYFPGEHLAI